MIVEVKKMKCKIIVVHDNIDRFEEKINEFIKEKVDCRISVSSTQYFSGPTPHTEYVACIAYSN